MRFPLSSLIALAGLAACPSLALAQAAPADHMYASRYDLEGRLVGRIAPDPDGAGPLTFPAGRNSYDPRGLLTLAEEGTLSSWPGDSDPAAWSGFTILTRVETQYDALGRKSVVTVRGSDNVATALTQYSYTASGRLECTAQRMNPAAFASLPASACALGAQGSQGPDRITRNLYDVKLQLEVVEKAVGTPLQQEYVRYTYTANGKQASVTDANGATAALAYDSLDRLQRWYLPSKTTAGIADPADYEEYAYDGNGNRTSLRRRDGRVLTFAFDALDRVTSKTVPDGCAPIQAGACPAASATRDVHYEYDLRGLQTKARFDHLGGEGVTTAYDGHGQAISSTLAMAGTSRTLSHLYDGNGNRTRITHPDGSFFPYEYDGLDRFTRISENGGDTLAIAIYDNAGRRSRSGWAAATDYAYDPAGRLQSMSHDLTGSSGDHVIALAYNPASQVVSRSGSNDSYVFSGQAAAGRRYTVNGLNQYTAAGPAAFAYDANGNLISSAGPAGTTSYVYDAENRLVSASGAHVASLVYDPLGRLFQVSGGPAGVTQFLYDDDALIGEYDPTWGMPHRYLHGPAKGVDDPIIWYHNSAAGWRQALVSDHQGSIVAVADMYGNLFGINAYDEWGIPGGIPVGRFGYTGQAWIPELGLWYYKARFYSPTLGRFLQTDPIGYEDQVNLYAYVGNDPVNGRDPTGLARCSGDERCSEIHQAAAEARGHAQQASNELRGLAAAIKGGDTLTEGQQSLLGAFEEKFGTANEELMNSVAGRIDRIGAQIGEEGQGVRIRFGGPNSSGFLATAIIGGNSVRIHDGFFGDLGGQSRASVIFHEVGHSTGLRDRTMPIGAPAWMGRPVPGGTRDAYGISATSWLGAHNPGLARRNNDNYNCYVFNDQCGGP